MNTVPGGGRRNGKTCAERGQEGAQSAYERVPERYNNGYLACWPAIMFFTTPTMTVTIAPATPPPTA